MAEHHRPRSSMLQGAELANDNEVEPSSFVVVATLQAAKDEENLLAWLSSWSSNTASSLCPSRTMCFSFLARVFADFDGTYHPVAGRRIPRGPGCEDWTLRSINKGLGPTIASDGFASADRFSTPASHVVFPRAPLQSPQSCLPMLDSKSASRSHKLSSYHCCSRCPSNPRAAGAEKCQREIHI